MKLYTANELIELYTKESYGYKALREWMDIQIKQGLYSNLCVPAFKRLID